MTLVLYLTLQRPTRSSRLQTRSYRWPWVVATLLSVNAVLLVMLLKDGDTEDAEIPVTAQVLLERQVAPTNDQLVQAIQPGSEAPS